LFYITCRDFFSGEVGKIKIKTNFQRKEGMSSVKSDFELPATAYGYKGQNGRVNLADESSAGGFLRDPAAAGFSHRTAVGKDAQKDMLRGNWESNKLSDVYFSTQNIDAVQNAIRSAVYRLSADKQWVIDNQSADELQIVMRGLFYQYAKNLPSNIPGQIAELNQLVVDWCVPKIISEIQHYQYYLTDISHMPVPLQHAQSMSSAGTKTLPLNPFM